MRARRSGSPNIRWSSRRFGPRIRSNASSAASRLTPKIMSRSAAQRIAVRSTVPAAIMATAVTRAATPSADGATDAATDAARVVAAVAGAPFNQSAARQRAIGGIRADTALPDLQVDWDSCWLDDMPLTTLNDWRHIIDGGRLADVEGSFVIAWRDAAGATHLARDGVGGR